MKIKNLDKRDLVLKLRDVFKFSIGDALEVLEYANFIKYKHKKVFQDLHHQFEVGR